MNKKTIALFVVATLHTLTSSMASVLISSFGTGDSLAGASFTDTWVGSLTQNATTSTIGSPATDFGSFYKIQSLNLAGNNVFAISAKLDAGNTATGFTVAAYTSLSDFAFATFSAGSFNSGGFSTASSAWTTSGAFNPSNVAFWGISGGSLTPTTVFRVSFDNLQATTVPEPGTVGLLALAAGSGIVTLLRRRG